MDDFDAKAVAAAEHEAAMAKLTTTREEASNLRHTLARLAAELEDARHEMELLRYEDDVERERSDGMKAADEVRCRLSQQQVCVGVGVEGAVHGITHNPLPPPPFCCHSRSSPA